ncbi:hypothetical protein [Verrucomicrobium spinosum]|uniref:hypothetical protein n=1 Tax=Verrucomicrobium spinosum TaxID=2736 RepID=UPI000A5EEFC2|nr:hypothetical protein [Verrucomicrobium spinosum]
MNATTITSSAPPANAADLVSPSHRRTTYYWKCDRPAAFHGTTGRTDAGTLQSALKQALQEKFPSARLSLEPGHGQGNHITFIATVDEARRFVRVEDGPRRTTISSWNPACCMKCAHSACLHRGSMPWMPAGKACLLPGRCSTSWMPRT